MHPRVLRTALALLCSMLSGCLAVPAARDRIGTTTQSAGAWRSPDGGDLILFELHGVSGLRDGVHGLAVPADWRALPRTARQRDGSPRLEHLLDGGLVPVGLEHPAGLRRSPVELGPDVWRPARDGLVVQWDGDLSRPDPGATYAVSAGSHGAERRLEVYGRAEGEWVLLQRLRLRSSRTGAGWVALRSLVYPAAYVVDSTLVAAPIAGGLLLTYILFVALPEELGPEE